jgi:hypothetical protein
VDTSWTEGDFGDARMLLAAHLMTLGGLGSTAEAKAVANGSGQFKVMAIGSLRLERFDALARTASTFMARATGASSPSCCAQQGGPRVTGAVRRPGATVTRLGDMGLLDGDLQQMFGAAFGTCCWRAATTTKPKAALTMAT